MALVVLAGTCGLAYAGQPHLPDLPDVGQVTLVEEHGRPTLANRELRLVFDEQQNTLDALAYRGRQLLGPGKGYVQTARSAAMIGRCVVTLGIAAFDARTRGAGVLRVTLNGQQLARLGDLVESGAAARSGLWGVYQEREICFDAAKLHPRGNCLQLELAAPNWRLKKLGYPAAAILWDCLCLEHQ
jgi:hypothetical protein